MAKVLGIGGVFFKANDPVALGGWYHDVLGLEMQEWGGLVFTPDSLAAQPGAATVFSLFPADTAYFAPSTKDFMINLAVDDLAGILERCAAHGVAVTGLSEDENGRFAHLLDPEGTAIELWQPAPPTA